MDKKHRGEKITFCWRREGEEHHKDDSRKMPYSMNEIIRAVFMYIGTIFATLAWMLSHSEEEKDL